MSNVSILARNAQLAAKGALLDGGYFEARGGTQPTSVEDAATGTLAVTIPLNNPAFATASGGSMDLDPPAAATATSAVNPITWGRFYTAADQAVEDVSISLSGDGGEVIATVTNILVGMSVAITFTSTLPEHP